MLSRAAPTEAIGALVDFMLVVGKMEWRVVVVVVDEKVYLRGRRMALYKSRRRIRSHTGLLRAFR